MAKKILTIDDSQLVTTMLQEDLKKEGYEVISASNGQEGLEKIRSEKPDLIILDVVMPIMDGYEVFKILKKDSFISHIPVIILTSRVSMKDTFDVLDADAFLPKPFTSTDLLAKINSILTKSALVLSKDHSVIEKIANSLKEFGFEIEAVEDEERFFKKGEMAKYPLIVLHLPYVISRPEDIVKKMNRFKSKTYHTILYCDSRVEGTENNDTVKIEEVKFNCYKHGLELFFDPRTAQGSFNDFLRTVLV